MNDVLISKWEEEERELREACAALVPMMEVIVCGEKSVMEVVVGGENVTEGVVGGGKNMTKRTVLEEETRDVMECIAGIYAVLDVVGVEYTLPEEQKNRLWKMIARAREAKRKETSG